MGVVWSAMHTVTRKRVALKLIKGSVHLRPELRARFLREARAATAVEHPNVLEVHDVFELDDATPVMVMDLLKGETLAQRIHREGKLSLADTATVFVQVVSGVGKAHAVDVVHRDLKPDNVFLVQTGNGPSSVRILDFGIAKLVGADDPATESGVITGTGTMLGTPCYMSPEQSFGEKSIDCRTDIWSLGAMLYECLTGCRPVEGDSVGQVVKRLLSDGITPIESILPELPTDVVQVIGRMLNRERERRPQDLREVVRVLAPYASVGAPEFGPPGSERIAQGTLPAAYAHEQQAEPAPAPAPYRSSLGHTSSVDSSRPPGPASFMARVTAVCAVAAIAASAAAFRWLNTSETPPLSRSVESTPLLATQVPAIEAPAATKSPIAAHTSSDWPAGRGSVPRSCAEVRKLTHEVEDGTYKLDVDGAGPQAPFSVYCEGMSDPSREPAEYISLARGAASGDRDANSTTFVWSGGACHCPELTRRFTKVRMDPVTMTVDISDGRFARYTRARACEHADQNHCGAAQDLSWGTAGSCRADRDTSGRGNIDLRDTPFSVAPDVEFEATGHGAAGHASFSSERKVVTLVGGGRCGSLVPGTAPALHLSRDR